jgi:hypothetical protein
MDSDTAVWELRRAAGVQGTAEVADTLHFAQIDLFLGQILLVTRLRAMGRKILQGSCVKVAK